MGAYLPSTLEERRKMLEEIGLSGFDELYKGVPESVRLAGLTSPKA